MALDFIDQNITRDRFFLATGIEYSNDTLSEYLAWANLNMQYEVLRELLKQRKS